MIKLTAPKLFYNRNRRYLQEENNVSEMNFLFERAVAKTSVNINLDTENSIRLNSLFNQATKGDFDFESPDKIINKVTKAEFEAWACLKGKSVKDAQKEYIVLVYELKI